MKPTSTRVAVALAAVVVAGIGFYFWKHTETPAPAPAPPPPPHETEAAPAPIAAPATTSESTAPATDAELAAQIASGLGFTALPSFVYPDRLTRRFVATVDALSREQVPVGIRAIRPVGGSFETIGGEDNPRIAPGNSARYAGLIDAFEHVPPAAAGELYQRLYPRLQQAYEELGYPGHSFHKRLLEVIDQLLATPDAVDGAALARPKVLYLYAEPALERRSAGQKALMRAGALNEARIKARLRLIRVEIANRPPR
jgi:Protein of unknown function (DUF3014)